MNFDPSQTPIDRIPDRGDEILADKESASTASSTTTAILGLIMAAVIIAVVIAWAPWKITGSSPSDVTPGQGGADSTPSPGLRQPDRPLSPDQPQLVPNGQIAPR